MLTKNQTISLIQKKHELIRELDKIEDPYTKNSIEKNIEMIEEKLNNNIVDVLNNKV